jgi:zinc transporter, ZIP family
VMEAPPRMKGILNAAAVGILLFLLVDIMTDAMDASQNAMLEALSGKLPLIDGLMYPLVLLFGIALGLLGLVWFEGRYIKDGAQDLKSGERAKRLALMIAIGIGLHNFSEGLAIGQSYAGGVVPLAITLVIGFGLHNMTEGFGIAAPLSGHKPSPKYLLLLGLIGGGPTFLGAVIGGFWVSGLVSVLFLSLAGGAVIYVVKELLYHGKISGEGFATMASLVVGFMAGFVSLVAVHYLIG